MSNKSMSILILVALAVIGVSMSLFVVDERQFAVKFKFGEIVRSDYEPGLHFKVPLVNNVVFFDRRLLTSENTTEEFLTVEKKNLKVDFFVKWRIVNVDQYYRSTRGDTNVARSRLIEIIKDGIRGEFAKRTVQQVVTAERREIFADMLDKAQTTAEDLGVTIVDVRVRRLDLPEEVSSSVFNRMRQERARIAAQLRAEGAESAERIRAQADRDRTVILANARRDSEKIRGEGDATSARTFAEAYEQNAEFYSFHRSLQAYRESLGQNRDIMVLAPDSEFFRYLRDPAGGAIRPPGGER